MAPPFLVCIAFYDNIFYQEHTEIKAAFSMRTGIFYIILYIFICDHIT